jgi:hypothetical protein
MRAVSPGIGPLRAIFQQRRQGGAVTAWHFGPVIRVAAAGAAGRRQWRVRLALPAPGSGWWLVLTAGAFSASLLLFVPRQMGLSWDEVVYVSQVSAHAPAAYFDAARARGVPVLVAPVTLITSSVAALRVYLALACGLGLLGALWAWRPLRPAWVLALAGLAFGGLWVSQYYGPQAMPDEWVALSGLAAAGFFLRAVRHTGAAAAVSDPEVTGRDAPGRGNRAALAGLTVSLALAALFRPGDAIFLAAPLVLAVLTVAAWRRWSLLACVVGGLLAGGSEWVAEAYLRFGGLAARLHGASAEQGGFGPHLGVWAQLRAVNGPTLCRPCTVGWRYPELSLWWLALPVLVALGLAGARRAGNLGSSLLATACGLSVAVQYLFGISYAAPRFLLPAYALLAIPVADALAWLVRATRPARPDLRRAAIGGIACVLLIQFSVQHLVLRHEVAGTVAFHQDYRRVVADLRRLDVRPPCLIKGEQGIPVAFYAGCASAPQVPPALADGLRVVVLEHPGHHPPGYARYWTRHRLRGTGILRLVAYLPGR